MGRSQACTSAAVDVSRLFLIRHAHAGDRASWNAPDDRRPLSDKGWRQARGLVPLLEAERIDHIRSSPSLRCVQTVMPLAEARGLAVEEEPNLLEGRGPLEAFAALEHALQEVSVAASTHGDLMPEILELAEEHGAVLPDEVRWPKGCTWVFDYDEGRWHLMRYLPPPPG